MSVLTRSTDSNAPRDRYRFSVEEYHQMIRTGLFDREDRLELLEGELIMMPPIGPEHAANSDCLRERIEERLPGTLAVRVALPITIPPDSEPEPDLCVVRRREDYYRSAHPEAKDVLLVIEISASSASFDAKEKALIYGRAGIPEYWMLDIPGKVLRIFTDPSPEGYRNQRTAWPGETVHCASIPQLEILVSEALI